MDKKSNNTSVIIIVVSLVACLCVCTLAVGGGALAFLVPLQRIATTQIVGLPTDFFATDVPTEEPIVVLTPVPTAQPGSVDTLELLINEEIPQRDLRQLAMRFQGITDIPEVVSDVAVDHPLGTVLEFNATNND